jgi:hypothetical protein
LFRPTPERDYATLRQTLWNAVEYAERGGHIDVLSNAHIKGFIESPNSASSYEILVLKRAAGEPLPTQIRNRFYALGDRLHVDARWGRGPVEHHTGVVWDVVGERGAKVLVDGKDGGAPFFVIIPADPNDADIWHPNYTDAMSAGAAAASDQDEQMAHSFYERWLHGIR